MSQSARDDLGDAFRWALEATLDPALAAADWLAHEIDADHQTAVGLLTDPSISLEKLAAAKAAYKTMRIVGETAADRRLGAKLYAAAIAAALAHHQQRISRQSDAAVRRAVEALVDDATVAQPLRTVAGAALCALNRMNPEATPLPPGEDRLVPPPPGGPAR